MAITIHSQQGNRALSLEEGAQAYRNLRRAVRDAGLLNRTYGYYFFLIGLIFIGFFLSFYAAYRAQESAAVVLFAICFAFFSVQIGGLIHDAGHRAIFKTARANDIFGHFCTLFFAACYNNWRINHNRHHAFPNQEAKDPDMEIPFAFTPRHYAKVSGFMGAIKKFQAYTYYPFGTLASLTMRYKRYDYFKENFGPAIYWEIVLFAVSGLLRYLLPFVLLGVDKALLFLVVSTMAEGLHMFQIFAPNHKGCPELAEDVQLSFLERQVLTARNVKGHPITDFVFMGLNYQIEHHLFPNTPRKNLPKLRPLVIEALERHKLGYLELGVVDSNRRLLSELKQISQAA
jgi:fatty acid desaturase